MKGPIAFVFGIESELKTSFVGTHTHPYIEIFINKYGISCQAEHECNNVTLKTSDCHFVRYKKLNVAFIIPVLYMNLNAMTWY